MQGKTNVQFKHSQHIYLSSFPAGVRVPHTIVTKFARTWEDQAVAGVEQGAMGWAVEGVDLEGADQAVEWVDLVGAGWEEEGCM